MEESDDTDEVYDFSELVEHLVVLHVATDWLSKKQIGAFDKVKFTNESDDLSLFYPQFDLINSYYHSLISGFVVTETKSIREVYMQENAISCSDGTYQVNGRQFTNQELSEAVNYVANYYHRGIKTDNVNYFDNVI